ncbi:Breast carcinoma-amplified sequence 3 like protein [Lucilia cuprina]|nr:Breast carcinoma-amplified sequence 3 like protein [Lucilia cuprina]
MSFDKDMSADSPRRSSGNTSRGMMAVPAIVPPQVVSDRSILDSAIGFINEVTLAQQPPIDPKDTITWARFETAADISDPSFGDDWELEGNVAPPLLLILGYGLGVQVWAIPANGEAVEVLSWRHGIVSALRVLPTPVPIVAVEENVRADEPIDAFGEKRPLIALVDGSSTSGSQPQFCAVNFISLKTAAQVKTIKFKNPVIDILANRSSVVITFHERIAVFDARTLEDRLSITTCYPSPGINPNPAALGPRWLAYAENKLLHSKRSGGGCDGDGVASYTATVLNASKSLVKGLRELGEQVAAGLTGTTASTSNSKNTSFDSGCGLETKQSGIVTIIDIKNPLRDYSPTLGLSTSNNQTAGTDSIIAHFIAHSEALVAMEFDNSGMLLVTADRRGHDFHVFRIQPNPVGSSLAAVHHLYILHRGDTSAKVQNITLTLDSRWVAVSTLRGTTHVFPITPYGGAMGVRTHTSLHVVNKLSRFHRSAGLSAEGRSNSPISHSESTTFTQSLQPYHNSTLPPFPRPTVVMPLAQLRQPFALGSPPGSSTLAGVKSVTGSSGSGSQRQRLSSLSDDNGKPLSVCAIFAKSRSWLLDPPNVTREAPHRIQRKAVDSLFVMAGHGALIQYDLDTKLVSNVAKEKICDDTPIELEVEAKAQWNLGRRKEGSQEIMPPLSADNWLIKNRNSCMLTDSTRQYDDSDDRSESWLAQVEIITHAGPHRRLWMGPQFVFKTYNTPSGSNLSHVEIEAVEIGTSKSSTNSTSEKIDHSSPLNMPLNATGRSSAVPVLIESGSYSSIEQSPKLMDRFRHDHLDSDFSVAHGDSRLKEDLADAMRESPSATASSKDSDLLFHNVDNVDGNINRSKLNSDEGNSNMTATKSLKYQTFSEPNNKSQITNMATSTLPSQQDSTEAYNCTSKNVKQQKSYFGNDGTSTIVNIEIFDDQLSTSSNSNTSRFSCEATPLSTTTPPISLNGVIDTNLMHFSPSTTTTLTNDLLHCGCHNLAADVSTSEHKCDSHNVAIVNDNCDDDNSSNVSGGSLNIFNNNNHGSNHYTWFQKNLSNDTTHILEYFEDGNNIFKYIVHTELRLPGILFEYTLERPLEEIDFESFQNLSTKKYSFKFHHFRFYFNLSTVAYTSISNVLYILDSEKIFKNPIFKILVPGYQVFLQNVYNVNTYSRKQFTIKFHSCSALKSNKNCKFGYSKICSRSTKDYITIVLNFFLIYLIYISLKHCDKTIFILFLKYIRVKETANHKGLHFVYVQNHKHRVIGEMLFIFDNYELHLILFIDAIQILYLDVKNKPNSFNDTLMLTSLVFHQNVIKMSFVKYDINYFLLNYRSNKDRSLHIQNLKYEGSVKHKIKYVDRGLAINFRSFCNLCFIKEIVGYKLILKKRYLSLLSYETDFGLYKTCLLEYHRCTRILRPVIRVNTFSAHFTANVVRSNNRVYIAIENIYKNVLFYLHSYTYLSYRSVKCVFIPYTTLVYWVCANVCNILKYSSYTHLKMWVKNFYLSELK